MVLAGGRTRSRALVVLLHGGTYTGRPATERAANLLADFHGPARAADLRLAVPVACAAAEARGGAAA